MIRPMAGKAITPYVNSGFDLFFLKQERIRSCKIEALSVVATVLACNCSSAAVSAEEVKQLGGPILTIFGAEKAGNKDGTIPPYTAEKVKFKFDPATPENLSDPWDEKPFSITAQNYTQYAERLTEGRRRCSRYTPTNAWTSIRPIEPMCFPSAVWITPSRMPRSAKRSPMA